MLRSVLVFLMVAVHVSVLAGVPQDLQNVSVMVKSSRGSGSGIVFTKTRDGETHAFIITAAHVVSTLRKQSSVIAPDGTKRNRIQFDDASVLSIIVENGRKIGQLELDAEVLRYSPLQGGEDLALLHVRAVGRFSQSARLFDGTPEIGAEVYHVGSMRGLIGAASLTSGIVAQQGRVIDGKVMDQTTATAEPGSSGGLVSLKDTGEVVGVLTQGIGQTFNFIVPARRVRQWAQRSHVAWLFNDDPMPSLDEIRSHPIEDPGLDTHTPDASVRTMEFLDSDVGIDLVPSPVRLR